MKNIFIYIYFLLISCGDLSDNIVGIWIHNDALHRKEVTILNKPMGNLSGVKAFGQIKLIFNNDYTYKSYFDNAIYDGIWEMKDNLIYMKQGDEPWNPYDYKLNKNELIIYDREWLMAFIKE